MKSKFMQHSDEATSNDRANRLDQSDRSFHDWYRFVLSFPPHLVRIYLERFGLGQGSVVLDPFCGPGTTIVEGKLRGIGGIGIEANPFPQFAAEVKTDWEIDELALASAAKEVGAAAVDILRSQGIDDNQPFNGDMEKLRLKQLAPEAAKLLLRGSISPIPLHKTLTLLECLKGIENEPHYRHAILALANALVRHISNLRFGPEVGVGKTKTDVPVVGTWLAEVHRMVRDLASMSGRVHPTSKLLLADSRNMESVLEPKSVDAVITSPPYPNEKDYSRTTRLESVILGFVRDGAELRSLKKTLVRSNTRGVYKGDEDDKWIEGDSEVEELAEKIEERRKALGKTSGFERLYPKVVRQYFGGMARHLAEMRGILRPGAQLAYVVGDQASYLRIMIRTGQLLGRLAERAGFELVGVDLFRTRWATATKCRLREEVVVLRWPG